MSNTSRTARAWVWGLLMGGAAGFAIGMLTAPEEGRRMRRRLAFQLDRLGTEIADAVDGVLEEASEGTARKEGAALVEDARLKAQKIRQDIDALMGEIRHRKTG